MGPGLKSFEHCLTADHPSLVPTLLLLVCAVPCFKAKLLCEQLCCQLPYGELPLVTSPARLRVARGVASDYGSAIEGQSLC